VAAWTFDEMEARACPVFATVIRFIREAVSNQQMTAQQGFYAGAVARALASNDVREIQRAVDEGTRVHALDPSLVAACTVAIEWAKVQGHTDKAELRPQDRVRVVNDDVHHNELGTVLDDVYSRLATGLYGVKLDGADGHVHLYASEQLRKVAEEN